MSVDDEIPQAVHQGWYPLVRSCDLARGQRQGISLLGHDAVVFRMPDGKVGLLRRHCPHMGGDLVRGTVDTLGLRCPIHHWQFDPSGNRTLPSRTPCDIPCQPSLPCAERYGIVFAFLGDSTPFALPETSAAVHHSRPRVRTIDMHYTTPSLFGFDTEHFDTVHHRELLGFDVYRHGPWHIGTRLKAGVSGSRLGDRLMRRLGMSEVETDIDYWGGSIVFGRHLKSGTYALITAMPLTSTSSRIFVVGMQERMVGHVLRRLLGRLRFALTLPAVLAFVAQDERALEGNRFDPSSAAIAPDNAIRQWLQHEATLPVVMTRTLLS